MGGYSGGEIASSLATVTARNYILENFDVSANLKRDQILRLIRNAMEEANKIINEKSKQDAELRRMGTTLEICLIYNNRAYIGHIGDS
ncbi:MAG: protein phosphatase 2C domain-containing protein, partial [Oscillospiraceae bacterium]|nr:protein phosphatase 2C domain-containing protein [Oscillospiraceae bacterium]